MKLRKDPLAASKLAKTILKTNPGIDRVTNEKLDIVDKLNLKKCKMSDHQRKLYAAKFESRRKKRTALYDRLKPKLEPSVRSLIEKYKIESKRKELPVAPLTLTRTTASARQQENHVSENNSLEYVGTVEDNLVTSFDETEGSQEHDSRRSSLRSSILEVTPEISEMSELTTR